MKQVEMCITSNCNLKCKHCYQNKEKNKFSIPSEKLYEVANFCIAKGATSFVLSGGEACLHPDYYEFVIYLLNKNLLLTLVTNGTIIHKEFFNKTKWIKRITFVISVDGEEERHDARRGSGTYKKTIATIEFLQKIGYKVKINVTLDENNYMDVEQMLCNPNFKEITFLPVGYAGAAIENKIKTLDKDYETLIKALYSVNSENECSRECKIYPKGISFNYDGSVFPCSLARDFGLINMGNIYDKPVSEVIDNFENSQMGKKLVSTDVNLVPKCNVCTKNKTCSKGCRIRGFKFFGNLQSPDPFACKLNNDDYEKISFNKLYWGLK